MSWHQLIFQSPWILLCVFLRVPILFLEPYNIAHHHPVVAIWLLLLLFLLIVALLLLLLLLFLQCLSVSPVYIPYCASSCYTINNVHSCSAVFMQVCLALLPRVLYQHCIILRLYFSKTYSSFYFMFLEKFFENFMNRKNYSWWNYARVTSKRSFINAENVEHTPKNDVSVIETIPWIGHLLM